MARFDALILAEKSMTLSRGDCTLPGIMARVSDGSDRIVGIWVGDRLDWGGDDRVHVYVKGRNGQTTMSTSMRADEARSLAESLLAMADQADVLTQRKATA